MLNNYKQSGIYVIGTRPLNGKMEYMSSLICKFLKRNKRISLFGLGANTNYYLEYILAEITKIERKLISKYLNPCLKLDNKSINIDEKKYMNGIKYLMKQNLQIKDYNLIDETILYNFYSYIDKIIYMIVESNSNVVVIDNLEYIKEDSEYVIKKLKQIAEEKNILIIIFSTLKSSYEETHYDNITSFNSGIVLYNYTDKISILNGNKMYCIK
ncbi:MAG: hypothetical protein IJX34_02845 [Clostridia bacterium]|nr:hypothetical protein [Clostridia bacterium]